MIKLCACALLNARARETTMTWEADTHGERICRLLCHVQHQGFRKTQEAPYNTVLKLRPGQVDSPACNISRQASVR